MQQKTHPCIAARTPARDLPRPTHHPAAAAAHRRIFSACLE
jgi:hypothetical protein